MERIAALTGGAVAVNPNTMYPLLRQLEAQGLGRGRVGAPRAPLQALLPDHGRRPGRVRAPARGDRAAARPHRRVDRGDPQRGRRPRVMSRVSAVDPGARPGLGRRGALVRPACAGRRGSTASRTRAGFRTAGRRRDAAVDQPPRRPRQGARGGRGLRGALRPDAAGGGRAPARHPARRVPSRVESRDGPPRAGVRAQGAHCVHAARRPASSSAASSTRSLRRSLAGFARERRGDMELEDELDG